MISIQGVSKAFRPAGGGPPNQVLKGVTLHVPKSCLYGLIGPGASGKSILQVLRENGVSVASDCEAGNCGTCLTGLLEGEADHRDEVLGPEERAANRRIAVCCSRAKSKQLVLDL